MTLPRGRRIRDGARPAWKPISFWPWTLAAAAAVVIIAFTVTVWLLAIASGAKSGTDRANARLDAVRTGLAAGAGAGAAVGLILAFRRQHHQEIATVLTDLDATERRITELYAKAVEQLGNDKAPVRLGGLYALERLAQDNPAHRQTIVDVICAYLRMPFSADPAPASKGGLEATENPGERSTQPKTTADGNSDTWQQERQVRLTAQRILAEHLRDERNPDQRSASLPGLRFWPGISLDLTGATLIGLDFHRVIAANARFDGATFADGVQFYEAVFDGYTVFRDAAFDGDIVFSRAFFGGRAEFSKAAFTGRVWFSLATFCSDAEFNNATFDGDTTFYGTTFDGLAEFQPATFADDVMFSGTTFGGCAWFNGVIFNGCAQFGGVTFTDDTSFFGATFGGATNFDGATFIGSTASRLPFKETRVLSPNARDVWPTGWCSMADRKGGHLLARTKPAGVRANGDQRS